MWQYQHTLQKKVIHSLHISISVEKNNQLNITCYLRRSPAFFVHRILGSLVRVTWTVHFLWFDSLWEKIITFLLLDSKNQSQNERQKSRPSCRTALSIEDHLVLRQRSPAWGVNKDISLAGFFNDFLLPYFCKESKVNVKMVKASKSRENAKRSFCHLRLARCSLVTRGLLARKLGKLSWWWSQHEINYFYHCRRSSFWNSLCHGVSPIDQSPNILLRSPSVDKNHSMCMYIVYFFCSKAG